MTEKATLLLSNRRDFVLGAASAAIVAALLPAVSGSAQAATFDEAVKALIGDAKPATGRISIDLPEIAENGNTVPLTFTVDSPMSDSDYVKAVHVLATANPRAEVASFYFSPASGKAEATSRIRLGKTQDVVAIAEMSDGKLFMSSRQVKVTIGGCGG